MPHCLVAGRVHESGLAALSDAGFSVLAIDDISVSGYAPHLADADALLIRTQPLTAREIAAAPRLRIVSRHGVGTDAVDAEALAARDIPLTIVGDVNALAVAEHAMALMFGLAKDLRRHDQAVRNGAWSRRDRFGAGELSGKILLLVGFGRIGRLLAGMAQAFSMRVLVFDPYVSAEAVVAGGARRVATLAHGLAEADYVSLHAPKHGADALIGAAELEQIKPGACLINTARGGLVDEVALAQALDEGRLHAAALDVFATEPPDPSHPLFRHDRILLSPHIAGLSIESAIRMSDAAARNIIDFFAGRLDPGLVVNGVLGPLEMAR